jgi:hypothetical protein
MDLDKIPFEILQADLLPIVRSAARLDARTQQHGGTLQLDQVGLCRISVLSTQTLRGNKLLGYNSCDPIHIYMFGRPGTMCGS